MAQRRFGRGLSVGCGLLMAFCASAPPPDEAARAAAVASLAESLASAGTAEERDALLENGRDLFGPELGQALLRQGDRRRAQSDFPAALDLYRLARVVAKAAGDQAGLAGAIRSAGTIHYLQGDLEQAMDLYRQSLELAEASGNQAAVARVLGNIGVLRHDQGNYAEALEYHRRSLALAEAAGDQTAVVRVVNNIAVVEMHLGEYDQALASYNRSLALAEAVGDQEGSANALGNIGIVHEQRGNHALALEALRRAEALATQSENRTALISMLINIGNVYRAQGDEDRALEYFRKSVELSEAAGTRQPLALALNNVGIVLESKGDYAGALEHHRKSLSLKEALGDRAGVARSLENIGLVMGLQGDSAQALDSYRKALAINEDVGIKFQIAASLSLLAGAHESLGEHEKALEFAQRAAAIAGSVGILDTLWEARTTEGMASRALGRAGEARRAFEEAIAAIETMRGEVVGREQEEQRFFEDKLAPYHGLVDLLVAQNLPAEALAYAERSKGRVLLDVLMSGRIRAEQAMTAEEKTEEERLRATLVSLNSRIRRESSRPRPDEAALVALNDQRALERSRLGAFEADLYTAHPELRTRRGVVPALRAEEAQSLLPDAHGAIVEYVVTESRTFLFVVAGAGGQPTLKVFPIEVASKDLALRVERFRGRMAARDLGVREDALNLYNLLLGPARADLAGKTKLIVVPDGPLWDLPFQALQPATGRWLLQDCAVAYAPSLSTLREMSRRRVVPVGPPTLLALGNPAVSRETEDRVRSLYRGADLGPLPEAGREARALARLYGKRSTLLLGDAAREDRLKSEIGRYDVVHLATHGILDDASPMYSRLILAGTEASDDAGRPARRDVAAREDGLLETWEIMSLDLRAGLVVLSACETARGRVGPGEGVIGMAWALFIAGSPSTVVSQWRVDSASTTELMLGLHRRLVAGGSRAGSLRESALSLMRDKRYGHPFYWAGFVVVGDGF